MTAVLEQPNATRPNATRSDTQAGKTRQPALVVIQLNGGNDGLNTLVPYGDSLYYDYRPNIRVAEDQVLHIDDRIGLHPALGAFKAYYDDGRLAVMRGIGYPNPSRSHFHSMGIWHTANPDDLTRGGWLGKTLHDLDPKGENPVLGLNFGRTLPRALQLHGVPIASVESLDTYGVLTSIASSARRASALETLSRMYAAREGVTEVRLAVGQTGLDAQRGAELLRGSVRDHTPAAEYPAGNLLAGSLQNVARVILSGLGTRVFYTQFGSFDTHSNQVQLHASLWGKVTAAVDAFFADLRAHGAADDVVVWIFSEFGRTVKDNGSGTDHGAGSIAFLIGDRVQGGLYGDQPSLQKDRVVEGDLRFNLDFRSVYASVLEQLVGVDSEPVLDGTFEQLPLFK